MTMRLDPAPPPPEVIVGMPVELLRRRPDLRREGIGTALILAAQDWGIEHGARRIMLEIHSKNHPAIQMARKLNYEFCGYNDNYFPNQDIALFFSRSLR